MREKCAALAGLIAAATSTYYCVLICRGSIQPVLAMWVMFCISVSASMWTYWSSDKHGLVSNIGNVVDCAVVWLTLVCIVCFGRGVRLGFTTLEVGCIASSCAVLLFWKISGLHTMANLALQAIMCLAYIPVYVAHWSQTSNTESFLTWSLVLTSQILALVPAVKDRDKLAIVYSARALVLVVILLALMVRIEVIHNHDSVGGG